MSFVTLCRRAASVVAVVLFFHPAAMAQTAPLDTLVKTASQWAMLGDDNQPDRMWNTSGAIMQKNINRQDWGKYLANLHAELGAVQRREWIQVIRTVDPASLPPGEYINVIFNSRFAKGITFEKVSLTQSNGKWIPVGYIVSKADPAAPQPAPAPAPAPANR